MKEKEAFEKIKIPSEKKRVFEQAVQEKTEITIKLGDEEIFVFIPQSRTDSLLNGVLSKPPPEQGVREVLACFPLGQDRYFYYGRAELIDRNISLQTGGELFLLQRRKTMRVQLPESIPMTLNLTEAGGKTIFVKCRVHDVSAGGLRFFCLESCPVPLLAGLHVKGAFHPNDNKSMPFEGHIRHMQSVETPTGPLQHYGLEFVATSAFTQKMTALTLDLQRRVITTR